jgi:hypothetical protein
MLPGEPSLLHALELLRQFGSLREPMILFTGTHQPDLIPLELLGIAGSLIDEDLALGLADTPFQAPLPLGGLVEGVMLALEVDAGFILLPSCRNCRWKQEEILTNRST